MEQEKELLHSQTSWLNEELKAKSEELLSLSRQKGNEILELKCTLENKDDEVSPFFLLLIPQWHQISKLREFIELLLIQRLLFKHVSIQVSVCYFVLSAHCALTSLV